MPAYLVRFKEPVVYLAGHRTGQRTLSELPVRAGTADEALAHALRTTIGGLVATVTEVADFVGPPPAIEQAVAAANVQPRGLNSVAG
jgi:hypothetical protein